MQFITSINGLLRTLSASAIRLPGSGRFLATGLEAIDQLAPSHGFGCGAMHEVLGTTDTPSVLLPLLLAKVAAPLGRIVWCDFERQFYPPAAAALGVPLERMVIVRPATKADELWAMAECLRCPGVSLCIASAGRLSRVQARRLQLAAETGGGVGVLLRPAVAITMPYAAATRWRVRPAAGERRIQRWSIELLHGHGGRIGSSVLLELCRETHHVRAVEAVADRPGQPKTATA